MRRAGLIVLALGLAACQGKPPEQAGGEPVAPRFTGKTLGGEYMALSDFDGKVVLLNVWATWCKPCRKELPELQALHRHHADAGFTVVGVSVDQRRARGKVKRLVDEFAITYPIVMDPSNSSVPAFQVIGYPTNILIGRGGHLLWRRNGMIFPEDEELDTQLAAALAAPK